MAGQGGWLERMSRQATRWTGSSLAFALALGTILVWAITGPIFKFSDTWQLVINTSTTIITFLMVFLIQRAQNKDSLAIHLKLNEIVAALPYTSNRLISAEELSEEDVKILCDHFAKLVELAKKDSDLKQSHSIEDAEADHAKKQGTHKGELSANEVVGGKRRRKRRRHRKPDAAQPAAEPHDGPTPTAA
jgi:low affinity Fe/Cu permease